MGESDENVWSKNELDKDKSEEGESNQGGEYKGSDIDEKEIAGGRNVKDISIFLLRVVAILIFNV